MLCPGGPGEGTQQAVTSLKGHSLQKGTGPKLRGHAFHEVAVSVHGWAVTREAAGGGDSTHVPGQDGPQARTSADLIAILACRVPLHL